MRGQVIDGIVTRIDNDYFLIQSGPLEAMVSYEVKIFPPKSLAENKR
jgi:hypothetical protein